jgi:hypothetical protein
VYLGRFKNKRIQCRIDCGYSGQKIFKVPEEKRTDVNIAIHLVADAYLDQADRLVIVSGDSDLVPAIDLIKEHYPEKQVIVYIPSRDPARGAAVEIRTAADKDRTFPQSLLRVSQLPVDVELGNNKRVTKPQGW